ncbi:MAG: sigma-70 family RNA polymerase sigma factor [Dehalococcoidia bacterium]|nr:sigma-70 family RNA polymerase sigma factor [Dehalococcoidia bacterium]
MRDREEGQHGHGMQTADPESLARRAAARDEAVWALVFEGHYRSVFAFVRSRLGNPDVAEDIASQVFEIAFSRAESFDYRGVPIEGWLFGIARNLVRDHIKKLVRRGPEAELVEAATPAESDQTTTIDLRQDLSQAMQGLTEDQQTVLNLRFLLDKSVEDTARLMERSEDAVKNLQRRALSAMQRQLVATGYQEDG